MKVQVRKVLVTCTAAAALLGCTAAAGADTRVVTFDDQAAGTTISDQYRSADGVRFDGQDAADGFRPYVDSAGPVAHSGDRVADINHCVVVPPDSCGEGLFTPRTVGRLDGTATAVSMYVGYLTNGGSATADVQLTARDTGGNPIGSQSASLVEGAPLTTQLAVTSATANIA